MIWLAASAVATLVIALALSRQRHDARAAAWSGPLDFELRDALQELQERCRLEDAMLAADFAAAKQMRRDRRAHAERILRAIVTFAECAQDERLERLRTLRVLARMAAAAVVAPPFPPTSFRLPELWATSILGALGHAVLVSPAERLLLRIYVLSAGFRLALRSMQRAAARPAWGRFERGLADWCALDESHLHATAATSAAATTEAASGRWEVRL
jgi:hypothetical protein